MAVAAQPPLDPFRREVYRVTRTKARPKHTLFGSPLEQLDESDRRQISQIDVTKLSPAGSTLHPDLERHKQELDAASVAQKKACSDLKKQRERAIQFDTSGLPSTQARPGSTTPRPHQWYKPDDLRHATQINRVGLNSRQSYNYDKYGLKPPVHKYALIGDIMEKGMDFAAQQRQGTAREDCHSPLRPEGFRPAKLSRNINSSNMSSDQRSVIDLPVNIKHLFGSKVCDSLLHDRDVVNETLAIRAARDFQSQRGVHRGEPGSPINPTINPSYEALGNIGRQNIFPGYSMNYTKSLAKATYTNDVHKHRVPPPDKFRYRRDELSSWSERNFLLSRLKKRWDDYVASVPKIGVNWDRTAKREAVSKIDTDKRKPKKKPQPKKKEDSPPKPEPLFEDVVFETPPITPPPPPPQPPPEDPPDYVRDNDFWEFFDQPVPA